ncbi:pex2 / pex12 amino terminal region domain-containing protein [Phthorimaea operculella]|nr:pex2 / pex12 amino terminal region domain-containing protein [Phthorimaea operculella]
MAVYAAHLTRTLSGTPSVFQVAAQEALGNTVKPALRKVVEYLAAVYPNKCSWLVDWYDELYLVFDCCLQYHYLKHYAASFSESFYGLLRVPTQFSSEFGLGQRLPHWAEKGSLALLVVLPYVRDKAEKITQRWREDDEDGRLGKNTSDRLRRAAFKLYSIIHFVCESVKLIQLAAYISGRSRSPTPALAALRLTLKDAPPQEADEYTWSDLMKSIFTGQIGSAVVTFPMVGSLALRCVEYGAFAVQFLRWWESREHSLTQRCPRLRRRSETSARSATTTSARSACKRGRCLQCFQCPGTSSATSVYPGTCGPTGAARSPNSLLPNSPWLGLSGYIFCYICISRYLRANRSCPVTKFPATEQSLVRMYLRANRSCPVTKFPATEQSLVRMYVDD